MGNQRLKDIIRQQQITIKGLDDAKGALIDYNNNLEAKIAEANKILELFPKYETFDHVCLKFAYDKPELKAWLEKLRKILANEKTQGEK